MRWSGGSKKEDIDEIELWEGRESRVNYTLLDSMLLQWHVSITSYSNYIYFLRTPFLKQGIFLHVIYSRIGA